MENTENELNDLNELPKSKRVRSMTSSVDDEFYAFLEPAIRQLGINKSQLFKAAISEAIYSTGDGDLIAKYNHYLSKHPKIKRVADMQVLQYPQD